MHLLTLYKVVVLFRVCTGNGSKLYAKCMHGKGAMGKCVTKTMMLVTASSHRPVIYKPLP